MHTQNPPRSYHPYHLTTLALLLAGLSAGAQAADWSDTFIGYRYGEKFHEPNNPKDVQKDVLQFTHSSGYKYGQNFLNVDILSSDGTDPANNSSKGAQEIYVTYRHQLIWGKVTGTPLAFGPVKDVALTLGLEANTKDTTFAPRKRVFELGPTIKFNVPGFWDVSLLYYKESNHKGIPNTPNPDVDFDPTYMLTTAWGIPFSVGPVPAKFQGFLNYTGTKGKDYNNKDTAGETLMRTSVMFDLGSQAGLAKGTFFAGVGYEYWKNKFGNQAGTGTKTNSPTLQLEWHF